MKRPEAAASGRSLDLSVCVILHFLAACAAGGKLFDACADLVEEADDDKHGADHGHDRARDLQDAFDGFHISALLFFLQYKPVFSILQGV